MRADNGAVLSYELIEQRTGDSDGIVQRRDICLSFIRMGHLFGRTPEEVVEDDRPTDQGPAHARDSRRLTAGRRGRDPNHRIVHVDHLVHGGNRALRATVRVFLEVEA